MSCAQMGGMCDMVITAGTEEEMLSNGMKHLEESHPEMAASVRAMPATDPMMVAWMEKFHTDFEATPEE